MNASVLAVLAIAVAVAAIFVVSIHDANARRPRAKFLPHDKVVISWGSISLDCTYWVEWGEGIWHVDVVHSRNFSGGVSPSKEDVSQLVAHAMSTGTKGRLFVDGTKVDPDPNWLESRLGDNAAS